MGKLSLVMMMILSNSFLVMSVIIHSLVPVVSLVHISQKDLVQEGLGNKSKPNLNLMGISTDFFYVAKCNLGKVNLETMLASGLLSCVT